MPHIVYFLNVAQGLRGKQGGGGGGGVGVGGGVRQITEPPTFVNKASNCDGVDAAALDHVYGVWTNVAMHRADDCALRRQTPESVKLWTLALALRGIAGHCRGERLVRGKPLLLSSGRCHASPSHRHHSHGARAPCARKEFGTLALCFLKITTLKFTLDPGRSCPRRRTPARHV